MPLSPHWFHILLALADKPQHGVAITEDVLRHSDGQLQLWPGMRRPISRVRWLTV